MHRIPPRAGALCSAVAGACIAFAGALSAQPPSAAPVKAAGAAAQAGISITSSPQAPARHRAEVLISGNNLEIRADNSSLNQILLTISQRTGMKIVGGVQDQRVFGSYGPGPAADVLSKLLDGTGVNMLLRMTPSDGLSELILSPRTGGPSPPSPQAYREDPADAQAAVAGAPSAPVHAASSAPAQPAPASQPSQSSAVQQAPSALSQVPPLPFSQPAAQPAATDPFVTPQTPPPGNAVTVPTVNPATEPGTTPGPNTQTTGMSDQPASNPNGAVNSPSDQSNANPASPNGVKTPQQIYQELQKLLQQQQPAPGAPQ